MIRCPSCGYRFYNNTHRQAKLTADQIKVIRTRKRNGAYVKVLAIDYDVSTSLISRITRDLSPRRRRGSVGKPTA